MSMELPWKAPKAGKKTDPSLDEKVNQVRTRFLQQGKRTASAVPGGSESTPSTFKLLHESDDGFFCLFQSAEGHLVAVPGQRLV